MFLTQLVHKQVLGPQEYIFLEVLVEVLEVVLVLAAVAEVPTVLLK